MAGEPEWRRLNPAELGAFPDRYSFSWPGSDAPLEASLARHGQLRPLLAFEGPAPVLVAGHRRASVLRDLGRSSAWVRVLAPPSDRGGLWDLLLEDHLTARALNPVELGLYLRRRLVDTGETPETLPESLYRRLGLPSRPAALEDFLWVADLPARHRDGFALGRLPVQGVRVLSRAPREDALAFLDLVAGGTVGVNKFSELGRWVLECAWAQGRSVAQWVEAEGLAALAGRPELLRPEVRRRRYPELTSWEEGFREEVRGAGLPAQAHLSHPPGFEGGRLTCTVSFAGLDELGTGLQGLLELLRAGRLDNLTRYLA